MVLCLPYLRRQKKEREAGEDMGDGEALSKKTWKRWVSAGMEPAESSGTVIDGDISSPGAPRGTGGPKSK